MEQNEELSRLEQFIEKLIESHNHLKNENNEMHVQLQAKQQEISELHKKIENLQEDRGVMHDRVIGLIGRIDEWEKNIELDEPAKNKNSGDNLTKKTSSLFNVTREQSSDSAL
jgi:FtsZ-binding cell division protein ZapB